MQFCGRNRRFYTEILYWRESTKFLTNHRTTGNSGGAQIPAQFLTPQKWYYTYYAIELSNSAKTQFPTKDHCLGMILRKVFVPLATGIILLFREFKFI